MVAPSFELRESMTLSSCWPHFGQRIVRRTHSAVVGGVVAHQILGSQGTVEESLMFQARSATEVPRNKNAGALKPTWTRKLTLCPDCVSANAHRQRHARRAEKDVRQPTRDPRLKVAACAQRH